LEWSTALNGEEITGCTGKQFARELCQRLRDINHTYGTWRFGCLLLTVPNTPTNLKHAAIGREITRLQNQRLADSQSGSGQQVLRSKDWNGKYKPNPCLNP
jgi:hypothetical protein